MNAKNFYTFPTSNYPSTFGYISCFIYDYPIFPSEKTSISRLLAAETRPKLSGEGTSYGATPWFTLFGRNQLEKTKEKNADDAHGSFHERTSLILGQETTGILLGGWHKQLSLYINLPYPSISTVSRIPRIKGQIPCCRGKSLVSAMDNFTREFDDVDIEIAAFKSPWKGTANENSKSQNTLETCWKCFEFVETEAMPCPFPQDLQIPFHGPRQGRGDNCTAGNTGQHGWLEIPTLRPKPKCWGNIKSAVVWSCWYMILSGGNKHQIFNWPNHKIFEKLEDSKLQSIIFSDWHETRCP